MVLSALGWATTKGKAYLSPPDSMSLHSPTKGAIGNFLAPDQEAISNAFEHSLAFFRISALPSIKNNYMLKKTIGVFYRTVPHFRPLGFLEMPDTSLVQRRKKIKGLQASPVWRTDVCNAQTSHVLLCIYKTILLSAYIPLSLKYFPMFIALIFFFPGTKITFKNSVLTATRVAALTYYY